MVPLKTNEEYSCYDSTEMHTINFSADISKTLNIYCSSSNHTTMSKLHETSDETRDLISYEASEHRNLLSLHKYTNCYWRETVITTVPIWYELRDILTELSTHKAPKSAYSHEHVIKLTMQHNAIVTGQTAITIITRYMNTSQEGMHAANLGQALVCRPACNCIREVPL